jgi:hypothetical protein
VTKQLTGQSVRWVNENYRTAGKFIGRGPSVRCQFPWLVPSLKNLEYKDRLRKLKLSTLKYRCLRGDMIETYKLTSGIYDSTLPILLHYNKDTRMRGHNKKLSKQRCNKNIQTNFFTQHIVTTWNQLPDTILNAPTMQSFENRLDKY